MVVFIFASELNIPPSETYNMPKSLVDDLLNMYITTKELEVDEMNKQHKEIERQKNKMR